MSDLGTLTGGPSSQALGINDSGLVVGSARITGNTISHAFSQIGTEPMRDLGTLGGPNSLASGVNNAGQVVGYAYASASQPHATIWSGPWKDLVANFGPGVGVWALRSTSWTQVHGLSPESMATGDLDGNGLDDLVIDFGPGIGVWVWMNHGNWLFLNPQSPNHLVTGDLDNSGRDEVVLDFPGAGLWVWRNNTSWAQLHPFSVRQMATANLDGLFGAELIVNFEGGAGCGRMSTTRPGPSSIAKT